MEDLLEIIRHTADGAYVIDEDQRITLWNDSAQALLGYSAEEVIGELCYKVLAGRDEADCPICQHDCFPVLVSAHGKPVPNFDALVRAKDGRHRWVNISIIAVPDPDGGVRAVVHLFRDIETKKQAEAFAAEVAARAGQLKLKQSPFLRSPFDSGNAQAQNTAQENSVATTAPTLNELTPRESQVLRLLVGGADTESIATELMISKATVRNHIQRILRKLGVHSRLEAVAYARERGII